MISSEELHDRFIQFTLDMHGIHDMPRSAVDDCLQKVWSLLSHTVLPYFRDKVKDIIESKCSVDTVGEVDVLFNHNDLPLQRLLTEHCRVKAYKETRNFIEPEKVEVGRERIFVIHNFYEIRVEFTARYMIYIPMEESVKTILETPGLMEMIDEQSQRLRAEHHTISNVQQTEQWQEVLRESSDKETVLPLDIFIDDAEMRNGMGSAAGSQKITGAYLSLPFLPQHMANKNACIVVLAIFYSKFLQLFGTRAIYTRIINDFNKLIREGIEIRTSRGVRKIHFRLTKTLGDNLALNQLMGYPCTFSSPSDFLRYCRMCLATNEMCKIMCSPDPTLARTVENYDELAKKPPAVSGLREVCVFNDIDGFHVGKNKWADLMHDLNIGIIPYTIGNILTALVFTFDCFKLNTLNDAIDKFNFGREKNKPRHLILDSSKKKGSPDGPKKRIKVKQSASEALCLARYLGLIIGHKVPRSNEHWQLYLIVRRLIDILTAPKYTRSDLWNLRNLIHAHNSMYFKLYGHLKPKMHFLLHYIELLLLNGPLINSWSMPFERKNKELRSIAVNTSSSVNLPLTLAFRNQIDFCSIQDRIVKLMPILEVGPVDSHFDNELSQFQNLRHIVNSTHCTHRSVKLYSKEYQPGSIVLIRVTDDEGPVFGRIHKIYSANNKVYFLFKKITTYYFYTHYHAYVVQTSDILSDFINVDLLPKPLVQCCLISKDGHEYIATRHQI
ncbi:hypothetical protein QAD02_006053 [Eretmocerus hayati]|uniref:Uncharacterized protein n=1 Tax=Eretmocerus hayati TaxID=131215 RepID=A0ACC2N0Z3_9HYME|nr:hypothetical protein QAD02_006053 [Eretmocerus hayati]